MGSDLPNWVLFPDQERVEFLNKCLKQMWPFLNLYIQKFIKEVLLPDIINYLPDYMKGLKFDTIDLGTVPIRLGSVKCHTERSSRREILLDLQLIYAGKFISAIEGPGFRSYTESAEPKSRPSVR